MGGSRQPDILASTCKVYAMLGSSCFHHNQFNKADSYVKAIWHSTSKCFVVSVKSFHTKMMMLLTNRRPNSGFTKTKYLSQKHRGFFLKI